MQVSQISTRINNKSIYNINKLQKKNIGAANQLSNGIDGSSSLLQAPSSYFIISFGASKNKKAKAVEEYFRLPADCKPDSFQIEAGKALSEGKDVLVEAPTGTGKTAIAHYAVSKNMEEGKTTFYTTPLKALSNQKLNEFREVYGDENAGILTGDRRENVEAPIVIMTTEVYRNMALSNMFGDENPIMKNLGTVIFDEFHYLGDSDRGSVWEESIMFTPKDVQTLELSATIGNPEELENWIGNLDDNDVKLVSIPSEARAVPLRFDSFETGSYEAEEKKIKKALKCGALYDERIIGTAVSKPVLSDFRTAVDKLSKQEQLPAIFFVFSKKFSRELQDYLADEGPVLTTKKEQKEIDKIIKKYKAEKYIGSDINIDALKKGYAIHNAGIMPQQKELIEELFQKKLTKVVISTETLAAGINMPAKTVVISSPYKPEDSDDGCLHMRTLTSNEFKQMAGRAGRRGIDEIGYVYTMPTDRLTEQEFLSLEALPANPITSMYDPDYAFLAGFYEHNSNPKGLKNIYDRSFYANSKDEKVHAAKVDVLMNLSRVKTNVMKKLEFLKSKDGQISLTEKGRMVSKVRGYDALTLVETIADKKFEGITPQALAMVAGAVANPANGREAEIGKDSDLSPIFDGISDNIDSVQSSLELSIKSALMKFGKNFDDFSSYYEMLDFIENIELPDVNPDVVEEEVNRLHADISKAYLISKTTGSYQVSDLVKVLKNGETIPAKVLNEHLEAAERYKNRVGGKSIDSHIEKLEAELDEQNTKSKGRRAKARSEKNRSAIIAEINEARDMKYLYENLPEVISSNYRFLVKHPLDKLVPDCKEMESLYYKLTQKEALISQIKGLIEIEEYNSSHNLHVESNNDKKKAQECIQSLIQNSLKVNEAESAAGIKRTPNRYGKNAAMQVYQWAKMNEISGDGMSNWLQLLRSTSADDDEGTIYRRIMQSADLLSQIAEIADEGMKTAENEYGDKMYYSLLKRNALLARNLLIREPVTI